jgi:predicted nucleotidyltransferase component of viral defense system
MLNISEISAYYPENLRTFKRLILREYLQYKILEIIYEGPYAEQLIFLGGTCLRLVHHNQRFSEDLDFDSLALSKNEFNEITENISNRLERMGYQVETKSAGKNTFHCYIRFPGLLFQQGLSGYIEEKILIQLDTEAQEFDFVPDLPILNKFDVFCRIHTTPLPVLMAQKCYAILNRKRNKGRDFFDLVFLMGKSVSPDLTYLKMKLNISDYTDLKNRLLSKCDLLDFNEMCRDVAPFLFHQEDQKKVKLFRQYLENYTFGSM